VVCDGKSVTGTIFSLRASVFPTTVIPPSLRTRFSPVSFIPPSLRTHLFISDPRHIFLVIDSLAK